MFAGKIKNRDRFGAEGGIHINLAEKPGTERERERERVINNRHIEKRQNLQDKILHAETFLIITSLLTPVYTYVICERFVSLLALGFRAS